MLPVTPRASSPPGIASIRIHPGTLRPPHLLKELEEALKTVQTVQYASNIELVRKYYDKIDPAL